VGKVGAIVQQGDRYGAVIAIGNPHSGYPVKIEWSDGNQEWLAVSEVEWSPPGDHVEDKKDP